MDRGAWRATVHWDAKSRTQLKQLSTHAQPAFLCLSDHEDDGLTVNGDAGSWSWPGP